MTNFTTELLTTFIALGLVLALAWLALRVLKRMQHGKSTDNELRFLRALPIGARERIVLVQCRDQEYLLGVTSGSISLLEKRPTSPDSAITPMSQQPEDKKEHTVNT
jgi:flagellar biosynthetic protein FliO